jgi:glycerol-3-phosphate dehydrogenase (NAD(P)+)
MAKIVVLGGGSWGTTLAILAARAGNDATLWVRDAGYAREMSQTRSNPRYLPDVILPESLRIVPDIDAALSGAEIVIFAVPSGATRSTARDAAPHLSGCDAFSAAKGLEPGSLLRLSEVLVSELGAGVRAVGALSGPNLAREIAAGKTAASVAASLDPRAAGALSAALGSPGFRVYTSTDTVGVEIGGALKNVIALAAGIADGLDVGDNGKAALMCRGLAEMSRLGVALGGESITISGLAGLGDLMATCASPLSRNLRAGRMLAEGLGREEITRRLGQVAEGMSTASAAVALGRRSGVDMPISEQVEAVVSGIRTPAGAIPLLMEREAGPEFR